MRERHFIAGSVLASVVEILAKRAGDGAWDLSGLIIVTPGSRAGRVLVSMLADRAATMGVPLEPPMTITPSELPGSVLVMLEGRHGPIGEGWRARPPASVLVRQAAWIRALRGQSQETLGRISAMEIDADDARGWASLSRVIARSADDLAAAGLRLHEAAERSSELADFTGQARLHAAAEVQNAYERVLRDHGVSDPAIDAIDAVQAWQDRLDSDEERTRADRVVEVLLVGVVELARVARRACRLPGVHTTSIVAGPAAWADRFDELGCLKDAREGEASGGASSAFLAASLAALGGVAWVKPEDVWIGDDPRDQACKALAALAQRSARTPIEPHSVLVGVPDPHVGFHLEREARRVGGRIRAGVMSSVSDTDAFRTCEALIAHAQERTLSTMRAAVLHPRVEAWVTERLIAHEEAGASRAARAMIRRGVLDAIDEYAKYAVHSSLDADFTTRKPELRWILGAVRDALDDLMGPVVAAKAGPEAAMGLLQALARVYRDASLDTSASPGQQREANAAKAIAQGLREAASDAADAFESGAGDMPSPVSMLRLSLEAIGDSPIAEEPEADAIEGLGWLEILLDPAPTVILTGMNAGLVPSRSTPDPLLPEALRRLLKLEHAGTRAARDATLFASMLACKQDVAVVLGRRDQEGASLMPSPVILPESGAELANLLDRFTRDSSGDLPEHRVRAVRRAPAIITARATADPRLPWVDTAIPESLSVTSLRDYIRSPYLFYLRHVLGVEEIDGPVTSLDSAAMGSLLHRALESLHTTCADSTDVRVIEAELMAALDAQVARSVALSQETRGTAASLLRLQVESVRARLRAAAIAHAAARQEGWRIHAVEVSLPGGLVVATEPDAPPLPILHGKIDRIDVNDAGDIRVIDYKTGDTAHTPESMHVRRGEWTDLQLPLYRHLARAAVDKRTFATMSEDAGDRRIELAYFNLSADPGDVGICVAEWDADALASADTLTRSILSKIVRGEFMDVGDGVDEDGAAGALAAWAERTRLAVANGGAR